MSGRHSRASPTAKTDLDDWETDPDFIRDMDEIDQRWGSKRTVGSINMNELIDEVRKDHKVMREKYDHSSQRDHSDGFGGKFGIQHDRQDQSAHDYNYHEKLSKHTSQEISRKVITSTNTGPNEPTVTSIKRTFLEKTAADDSFRKPKSPSQAGASSEDISGNRSYSRSSNLDGGNIGGSGGGSRITSPLFEESSTTKRIFKEETTSASSSLRGSRELPQAFKSIQDKIDAFKKEFEDIENKVSKKADLSKIIKKTTNVEQSLNEEYVSRPERGSSAFGGSQSSGRPATSPKSPTLTAAYSSSRDFPKADIKSLSQKFESLGREDSDDFKKRTEAKRKEFFDQIKTQVRETRKGLDGFDPIDNDGEIDNQFDRVERKFREKTEKFSPVGGHHERPGSSPRPSSRLSNNSPLGSQLGGKPKMYTRRETTEERVVSKIVKENDRVVEDVTKRNVERSSSVHGSSEDENEGEPSSIRYIDKQLRSSPTERTESPVDRLKREIPEIDPEIKGAGLMARTLYDYQATESDELSFDVDDLITNIEKIDQGWYKGTITDKKGTKHIGLFPANYVKLLNDNGEY